MGQQQTATRLCVMYISQILSSPSTSPEESAYRSSPYSNEAVCCVHVYFPNLICLHLHRQKNQHMGQQHTAMRVCVVYIFPILYVSICIARESVYIKPGWGCVLCIFFQYYTQSLYTSIYIGKRTSVWTYSNEAVCCIYFSDIIRLHLHLQKNHQKGCAITSLMANLWLTTS